MLGIEREITPIGPETIINIGNLHIANSTLLIVLITIVLLVVGIFIVRRSKVRPTTFQIVLEILYEGMIDLISQITGSKRQTETLIPIITAIFIYVGISNLISIIPGLTSITVGGVALFRSPTADFNTTFGLAFGSVVVLHFVSICDYGFLGHLGKFFKFKEVYFGFKKSISDGVMSIVDFLIGLLDIIGEIAKVVSLSLRLFGNMYAGEVLGVIIMGALAYAVPSIWSSMGLLTGTIQALVFGSLITAYYTLSAKPDEVGS